MGKVIAAAAYSAGRKVADIAIKESGQWAAKPGHFVWIGIHQPNERELRELQAQFQLHDLAIEDALHAHQRPKLEAVWGHDLSFWPYSRSCPVFWPYSRSCNPVQRSETRSYPILIYGLPTIWAGLAAYRPSAFAHNPP